MKVYHGGLEEIENQICFYTTRSLQMLQRINKTKYTATIDDAITQSLAIDYGLSEEEAIDIYFESKTYKQLIDRSPELSSTSWEDVYEELKQELKKD